MGLARTAARLMAPTDAQEVHHVRAIVGVAMAGAIGALIRWGLGTAIGERFPQFPWATMVINVTGRSCWACCSWC